MLGSALLAGSTATAGDDAIPFGIEITSPLGRSGLPGTVRIVARLEGRTGSAAAAIKFFANGTLVGADTDGPPYAIEWVDENPFEECVLAAEVTNDAGVVARDEVVLKAFEVVEASYVMSVAVEATVTDAKGRSVRNLGAADFQVLEDGEPQQVDMMTTVTEPAVFALLVDSSQSMQPRIERVRHAVSRMTSYVGERDTLVIAPFTRTITTVTGPTRDPETLADAVAAIRPSGGTAIFDALQQVTGQFADGEGRRVVVLVTDGYDEHSQKSADEALERLKASRVTTYVVAVGGVAGVSLKGEKMLKRLAEETGGRAFFPWNDKELGEAYAAIANDVLDRYMIAYTPANQQHDGRWRTITVTTSEPTHKVRARPGYAAPAPPPVRASIEFTATNAAREFVDLSLEDLEVIEEGTPQAVEVFQEAVSPVSIVLALDASGSMKRAAPVAQSAAATFVKSLRSEDKLGLMMFADQAKLVHDLTDKRASSLEEIDGYTAAGGTALYDALTDSLLRLRTVEGRRAIVVVTDGFDENAASNGPGSTRTWEDVLAAAAEVDVVIYAIGLGARVDRPRLEKLASLSGGEAYFTQDVLQLELEYRRVLEELRRRYIVAYTSTDSERNGEWRRVEIRTRSGSAHIRSRGGYFAPPE